MRLVGGPGRLHLIQGTLECSFGYVTARLEAELDVVPGDRFGFQEVGYDRLRVPGAALDCWQCVEGILPRLDGQEAEVG